jgi:hypothetical protein
LRDTGQFIGADLAMFKAIRKEKERAKGGHDPIAALFLVPMIDFLPVFDSLLRGKKVCIVSGSRGKGNYISLALCSIATNDLSAPHAW